MNPFYEMFKKTTLPFNYDQMLRVTASLNDCFGINHFWCYKITFSGHYSYFGLHSAWNEFCCNADLIRHFPCLRHPDALQTGINLMKASPERQYREVLDIAWERFGINFCINVIDKTSEGVEAFGFATRFRDPYAEQRLLNELPLLRYFIKNFRAKYAQVFQSIEDHRINLSEHFGSRFYEHPGTPVGIQKRDRFLRSLGFEEILALSPREKDVLKLASNGYPAKYIAEQLGLCHRTVENYTMNIKSKLSCHSKVDLIRKAQEIASTGYLDF